MLKLHKTLIKKQFKQQKQLQKMETSHSVIVLCVLSLILYKLMHMKKRSTPPLPPGPTAYPIIGSLLDMLKKKPAAQWIHKLMQELQTEIACIRLGSVHVIAVTSPELSREFIKKHDAIFASRPDTVSARVMSDGYLGLALTPFGEQWKKMKKVVVSEVLSTRVHRLLHAKRCEEADHLVRYVYNQCQNPYRNGVVDVREVAQQYCGNMIRKLMFSERFLGKGMEDGGPGFEEREYVAGLFKILEFLNGFAVADCVPWLEVFDLDGHKRIMRNAVKSVRKYQDPIIMKRLEMWQQGIKREEEDILDILINLKNSENKPLLSVQEIKVQILVSIVYGFSGVL